MTINRKITGLFPVLILFLLPRRSFSLRYFSPQISLTYSTYGGHHLQRNEFGGSLFCGYNEIESDKFELDKDIMIRKANWEDLSQISKVIVEGLNHSPESILYHPRRLMELSRLQNNFHYNETRHLMLVATEKMDSNEILAFVDIDGREYDRGVSLPANFPPRPYLSDLFVTKRVRGRGIGTALVRFCEVICFEEWKFQQIYLRVERFNKDAIKFYDKIGFSKDLAQQEQEISEKKLGFALGSQVQMWRVLAPESITSIDIKS